MIQKRMLFMLKMKIALFNIYKEPFPIGKEPSSIEKEP